MHRTESPDLARLVLKYLQAKYIRSAAVHEDGQPRVCPNCGGPTQVVNQRQQHGRWDFQAMKVGCANPECRNYLRNIDERPPFSQDYAAGLPPTLPKWFWGFLSPSGRPYFRMNAL